VSVPLFVALASGGLCSVEGSLLLPCQSSGGGVNPGVGVPRASEFVWNVYVHQAQ
jgi:hypothetical protein